jgi:hypothetical protein
LLGAEPLPLAIRNSLPGVTLCKGVAATVLSCGELGEVLVVLAGNTRFAELLGGAAAAAQPGSAAVSQTSRSNSAGNEASEQAEAVRRSEVLRLALRAQPRSTIRFARR